MAYFLPSSWMKRQTLQPKNNVFSQLFILLKCRTQVMCRFFKVVEQCSENADGLFKCLKSTVTDKKIPLTNIVGFSADITNCMFGKDQSVAALLKKDLLNIVSLNC